MAAAAPRFVVVYEDRRIALVEGEYVVGRGIACDIRLNAETVSRQHLKLVVRGAELLVENLSQTSGTLLNGQRLTGGRSLHHGDELTLGQRRFSVEVASADSTIPIDRARSGPEDLDSGDDDEELTMPGVVPHLMGAAALKHVAAIDFHTCPQCRARVAFDANQCAGCGYAWSALHPSAVTSRVTQPGLARVMIPVRREVPVVYGSDELMIDALVTDLRLDGAFVPSELLDPAGTACELTLLPDGVSAITINGVVRSVRARADLDGPAGMAVAFLPLPPSTKGWLERWVAARRGP